MHIDYKIIENWISIDCKLIYNQFTITCKLVKQLPVDLEKNINYIEYNRREKIVCCRNIEEKRSIIWKINKNITEKITKVQSKVWKEFLE